MFPCLFSVLLLGPQPVWFLEEWNDTTLQIFTGTHSSCFWSLSGAFRNIPDACLCCALSVKRTPLLSILSSNYCLLFACLKSALKCIMPVTTRTPPPPLFQEELVAQVLHPGNRWLCGAAEFTVASRSGGAGPGTSTREILIPEDHLIQPGWRSTWPGRRFLLFLFSLWVCKVCSSFVV